MASTDLELLTVGRISIDLHNAGEVRVWNG
jgi:hypothetical protein